MMKIQADGHSVLCVTDQSSDLKYDLNRKNIFSSEEINSHRYHAPSILLKSKIITPSLNAPLCVIGVSSLCLAFRHIRTEFNVHRNDLLDWMSVGNCAKRIRSSNILVPRIELHPHIVASGSRSC